MPNRFPSSKFDFSADPSAGMITARRRIEQAQRDGSTELNLVGLQLTTIPDALWRLTTLKSLSLANNQLTALPEALWQLTGLLMLRLHNNQLAVLPEMLGQLTALKSLSLNHNQFTRLPEALGELTALESLSLNNNQLTTLPETLGRLTALETLWLNDNHIATLPEALGRLPALKTLWLNHNHLTTLPMLAGQWPALETLSLANNYFTMLPEALGQWTSLRLLRCESNQLIALPSALQRLAALKRLCLHENPALGLPDEVLGPTWQESLRGSPPKPPREILDYYFSTRGAAGTALRELRLIVVGRPRAGKTTLIRRLLGLPMNLNESETHGIDILPLDLDCADGAMHTRVWDFGGQHVLHAMHEFFLRRRCLYLLVVEQRTNDVERDLIYWLQLIRSQAGDAPVVVALNQSRGVARPLARAALERDYGPILAWVPTECEREESAPGAEATIEALQQALTEAAATMPEPRQLFPVKWLAIKTWLERMDEPYLDYATYAARCAELHEHDPAQQAALAEAMDDLGVALNFARDPRLRDTTVLRPNWLANGIYSLLRANILTSVPLVPDAVLTVEKVGEILAVADRARMLKASEYPREKWPFLLRLMNLFRLSFPLDAEGLRYLAPSLLPADEPPECGEPEGGDVVKLRYEFGVVPGPLIGRFLVRLFALIERKKAWGVGAALIEEKKVWQRGARLRYATAVARVWADLDEKYVYATVAGGEKDRTELQEMIRETLKQMFAEYERLRVVEQWKHKDKWVPRETLEEFGVLPRDEREAIHDSGEEMEEVQIFISYAHRDPPVFHETLKSLLCWPGVNAKVWTDKDIVPGTVPDQEIRAALDKMDIFVALITPLFDASQYIQTVEVPAARRRKERGEVLIAPVVVTSPGDSNSDWLLSLERLPHKQKSWAEMRVESFATAGIDLAHQPLRDGIKRLVDAVRARSARSCGKTSPP